MGICFLRVGKGEVMGEKMDEIYEGRAIYLNIIFWAQIQKPIDQEWPTSSYELTALT